MCVHANGVIVTRMSHSQPWGSALPSQRGQPRAPWMLPASSPGLGSVLTTRAQHPSGSSQDTGLGKLSFLLLEATDMQREWKFMFGDSPVLVGLASPSRLLLQRCPRMVWDLTH